MNARDWFYRESFLNYADDPAPLPAKPRFCVVEQWDAATQTWNERIVVLDSEAK